MLMLSLRHEMIDAAEFCDYAILPATPLIRRLLIRHAIVTCCRRHAVSSFCTFVAADA